jgi:hypothetical protein
MNEILQIAASQLWTLTVELPARMLTREGLRAAFSWRTARRLLMALVTILAMYALAQTLSADLAFLMAGDLAAYFDIMAVAWVLGATGRLHDLLRGMRKLPGGLLRRRATRPRVGPSAAAPREHGPRPVHPPASNDNEDGGSSRRPTAVAA